MRDLAGSVALVTGAASGIGAAVAERLAGRGAKLALVDRDADGLARHAAATDAISLAADVSDPEAMTTAVAEAERQLGRLDLLFLNAGIGGGQTGLDRDLDLAAYRALVGVNVDHVVCGTSAAVPALRRAGGGTVIATSSLAGLFPLGADPLYTMTKHAVVGYVRAAAEPLAADGIRILALCPGFVDTPLIAGALDQLKDFPLITTGEIATAVELMLADGESGQAWVVQPGRPAEPFRFPGVPGPAGGETPPPVQL